MFESPHPNEHHKPTQPSYLRKKKLYQQSIRKKDRECLIGRLRKNAQLPNEVAKLLQALPQSINQLLEKLAHQDIGEWEETVAYLIAHGPQEKLKELMEGNFMAETQILPFFAFLLSRGSNEINLYNDYYYSIRSRSKEWPFPKRIQLFCIFNVMLIKGHSYILQDAHEFLNESRSNRFFLHQLNFYDYILRKFPSQHNIQKFLPKQTLRLLTEHIGIHFYSEREKISMMEILIQVLYRSEEAEITRWFDLEQLFGRLEYFFGFFNTNKMLIDRAILLVYNLNIDAGSEKFANHSKYLFYEDCSKIMAVEMRDAANPKKLRSLMAQLYLNTLFHFPQRDFYRFLKANISVILGNLEYIVQQFSHDRDVSEMIVELLEVIFSVSTQEESPQSQNSLSFAITSHPSFLNSLQQMRDSGVMLYHFQLNRQQL